MCYNQPKPLSENEMRTKKTTRHLLASFMILSLIAIPLFPANSQEIPPEEPVVEEDTVTTPEDPESSIEDAAAQDLEKYNRYQLYQKYEKKQKYKKYSKAKKRYGFDSSSEKAKAKEGYKKYKLFKKEPARHASYAQFYPEYKKYSRYKKNVSPASKYSKYKKYNKGSYDAYKNFGTAEYKAGHDRHLAKLKAFATNFGEADLGCGIKETGSGKCLGPLITVGLWSSTRDGLKASPFKIKANQDYNILNSSGTIINPSPIPADTITRVTYDSNGKLKVTDSIPDTLVSGQVDFVSASKNSNIVFDAYRPDSPYDQYRHSMRVRYSDHSKLIWAINVLPMEHYVWGMGEIKGTGDMKYNEVMTISFRTYGYWKLKFSTKFASEGFKVNATPGNQLYYGYDYEVAYPRIKQGANITWSKLMMFNTGSLNEIAITPYSSWTDGRTRSFQERWGSTAYPWCKSVSDPYGKHATKSTSQLQAEGNHMVGLSANGALKLARDHSWAHEKIMKYYYSSVNFINAY